jgi:hypothetical protein
MTFDPEMPQKMPTPTKSQPRVEDILEKLGKGSREKS